MTNSGEDKTRQELRLALYKEFAAGGYYRSGEYFSKEEKTLLCEGLLALSSYTPTPRVGLPLLYNIVCLWAQKKDDEWFKDMAGLCRLADKLLYEHGYEVSPYTLNAHQIAADTIASERETDSSTAIPVSGSPTPASDAPRPEYAPPRKGAPEPLHGKDAYQLSDGAITEGQTPFSKCKECWSPLTCENLSRCHRASVSAIPPTHPLVLAAQKMLAASDQFVRDTGLKHGDALTDAAEGVREALKRTATPQPCCLTGYMTTDVCSPLCIPAPVSSIPPYTDEMLARGVAQLTEAMKHPELSKESICGMVYDGMTAAERSATTPITPAK